MTCECDILSKGGIFHIALGLCRNILIHFNILMKTYLYINDAEIASENNFFSYSHYMMLFWEELSLLPYRLVFHLLEALDWNRYACSHLLTSAQVVSQEAIGKQKLNQFFVWCITHVHTWISFYHNELDTLTVELCIKHKMHTFSQYSHVA